jgi:putative transcriptional regulator
MNVGDTLNNRVKLARLEKSMTQIQLAKKVKVTRQTIGLIEKGEYNPSLQLCIAIAKALEKTLDELFWEVESH